MVVKNPPLDHLQIRIRSREKLYFEGEVESLSSINTTGKFDILPKHANFITFIVGDITVRQKGGKSELIKADKGVLKVASGIVDVYLEVPTKK